MEIKSILNPEDIIGVPKITAKGAKIKNTSQTYDRLYQESHFKRKRHEERIKVLFKHYQL